MSDLSQSFVGTYGSVRYYVETVPKAKMWNTEEARLFFEQLRGHFTLKPIYDLNSLPDLQTPAFLLKDNSGGFGSFFRKRKDTIRFTLKVSKRGFIPSEGLHFNMVINNESSSGIHSTSLQLIQVGLHKIPREYRYMSNVDILICTIPAIDNYEPNLFQEIRFSVGQISREEKKTVTKIYGPSVTPKTIKTWEGIFMLPENLPVSASSSFIRIKYELRVRVEVTESSYQLI
jgi:hypothetical protein